MFEDHKGVAARSPQQGAQEGEDWLAALDAHDVRYLVLDRREDAALVRQFGRRPGWAVDFEDPEAVVFARVG